MMPNNNERPFLPPNQLPGAHQKRQRQAERAWLPVAFIVVSGIAVVLTVVLVVVLAQGNTPSTPDAVRVAEATPEVLATLNPDDSDNDGIPNDVDNCVLTVNADQADTDGDGAGDACDADTDGDGVPDVEDNCPFIGNAQQSDTDSDGTGDVCDADADNDGVLDADDNCPFIVNPEQDDTDADGNGDACDTSVDLAGLLIELAQPIYQGTLNPVNITITDSDGSPLRDVAGVELQVNAGALIPENGQCTNPVNQRLVSRNEPFHFQFCPPKADISMDTVTFTVLEVDEAGTVEQRGAQIIVDNNTAVFTLNWQQSEDAVATCSAIEEQLNTTPNDYLIADLTLNHDAEPNLQNLYQARLGMPAQAFAIFQVNEQDCAPTTITSLTTDSEFNLLTNQTYRLVFDTNVDTVGNYQLNLLHTDYNTTLQWLPVLRANTNLNLRVNSGEIGDTLDENDTVLLRGVGGEGVNQWALIQRESTNYWLNIGNLAGNYTLIGDITWVPNVSIPDAIAPSENN
jgi:hypothetical protein